jgi:hypothetical protein
MLDDYVLFNEHYYPIRTIMLKNNECVLISTTDLNKSLFNNNEQYISDYAKYVDEQIFFFVDKSEIVLPENALSDFVFQEALA